MNHARYMLGLATLVLAALVGWYLLGFLDSKDQEAKNLYEEADFAHVKRDSRTAFPGEAKALVQSFAAPIKWVALAMIGMALAVAFFMAYSGKGPRLL